MIADKEFKTDFIDNYAHFEAGLGERKAKAVHQTRLQALENLKKLDFPVIKHEEWKYTNLRTLSKEFFETSAQPVTPGNEILQKIQKPENTNILVFINGVYTPELSQIVSDEKQITIQTWQEAEEKSADILVNYFGQIANTENIYFTALNTAYTNSGVFIHISKSKAVEQPVLIYHIEDTTQAQLAVQPRNLIVAEENSQATIVEIHETVGEGKIFFNQVSEIFVAQYAHIDYYQLQNESEQAYHISTIQVLQKDKSFFSATTLSLNGGIVRNDLNIVIDGQHCESFMNGLSILQGKSHVDHHTLADHQQPNCYSNELYKGVFGDKSTGVFNGKIYVRPDAQKTNAFQQNRNILLTDEANIYTKPQLEIWADDVKCSHGATTGQLDEDAMFYMRARGISESSAKALLMQAFAGEVLERIQVNFLKEYVELLLGQRLDAIKA